MIENNQKEYEFLKNEISTIRSAITTYVSYIVGLCGLAVIVASVVEKMVEKLVEGQTTTNNPIFVNFTCLTLLTALTLATMLFEIIWYKFQSHNRVAGYMTLLAQELCFYQKNDKFNKNNDSKNYLNSDAGISEHSDKNHQIIAWEFIMNRFNESSSHGGIDEIIKSTDKSFFLFDFSEFAAEKFDRKAYLDRIFFKEIIYKQFHYSSPSPTQYIWTIIQNFYFLFSKIEPRNSNVQIDSKYLSSGWLYPRKLLQIGLFLLVLISIGIGSQLFCCYNLYYPNVKWYSFLILVSILFILLIQTCITEYNSSCKVGGGVKNISLLVLFILAISIIYFNLIIEDWKFFDFNVETNFLIWLLLIIIYWSIKFVRQSQDLFSGKYSIQYYCWLFFVYRIQYLNSLGIVPKYYSRGFYRFLKNETILQYILKNKNNMDFKLDISLEKNNRDIDSNNRLQDFSKNNTTFKHKSIFRYLLDYSEIPNNLKNVDFKKIKEEAIKSFKK